MIKQIHILIMASIFSFSLASEARTIWLAGNHHETMTIDSMYCAAIFSEKPSVCSTRPDTWQSGLNLEGINLGILTTKQAEKAVRYPDDPVSELSFKNPIGLIRWSWNMGVVGCSGKTSDITTGLRCSAHYGDFQFIHSMSSREGVEARVTKSKVMAWVKYLALIVENKMQIDGKQFIEQNHCDYWSNEKSEGNPIAEYMIPDGLDKFPCVVNKGKPWTVATMFAFNCKNKIVNCDVDLSQRNVRTKAIGSMLHLVQDSFSQGHALRGDCCNEVSNDKLAAYQCVEIKQFNVYQNQNKKRHKHADKAPVAGVSCGLSSPIDDPILSGANILWLIKNKESFVGDVISYFDQVVFKLENPSNTSSAGEGFYQ